MSENIIDIDLKKGKKLFFSISIETDKPVRDRPLVRLILQITKEMSVALTGGKMNSNGEIEFDVPVMYGMLMPRKYSCDLELILDGQFFVPINFLINFK